MKHPGHGRARGWAGSEEGLDSVLGQHQLGSLEGIPEGLVASDGVFRVHRCPHNNQGTTKWWEQAVLLLPTGPSGPINTRAR